MRKQKFSRSMVLQCCAMRKGAFAAAYHVRSGTGYLVRPDGYICYYAQPVTKDGILLYLSDLLTLKEPFTIADGLARASRPE